MVTKVMRRRQKFMWARGKKIGSFVALGLVKEQQAIL